jgi:Domain of unknown function DUF302
MNKFISFLLIVTFAFTFSFAGENDTNAIYTKSIDKPLNAVYDSVYAALENEKFWVIFEPNIGNNLSKMTGRLGDDYNKNNLKGIRSLVFCNPGYANQVSNLDPAMLAICPLSATLIQKENTTTILFVRPSLIAKGSNAEEVLTKVEKIIISAIEKGMK